MWTRILKAEGKNKNKRGEEGRRGGRERKECNNKGRSKSIPQDEEFQI
jgi:hypothetical protein